MRTCRNCGQVTVMMCQLDTGFCCANCEDRYAENLQTIRAINTAAFGDEFQKGLKARGL